MSIECREIYVCPVCGGLLVRRIDGAFGCDGCGLLTEREGRWSPGIDKLPAPTDSAFLENVGGSFDGLGVTMLVDKNGNLVRL